MSCRQSYIPVHVGHYCVGNNPVASRSRVEDSQVGIGKPKPRIKTTDSPLGDRPRIPVSNIHIRASPFEEEQSYSVGIWFEDTLFTKPPFALAKVWIVVYKSDMRSRSLRSFLNFQVDKLNQVIVLLAAVVIKRPFTKYSKASKVALVSIGIEKFGIACNIDMSRWCKPGSQPVEKPVKVSWKDGSCIFPTFRHFSFAWASYEAKDTRIHDFAEPDIISPGCDGYLQLSISKTRGQFR